MGVLDLPYIVSTGKIWPKDFLKFEFNPARKDGKCSHELCFGCQKHSPPITVTHEYEAFLKLNDGHPPTRNARNNKGSRYERHRRGLDASDPGHGARAVPTRAFGLTGHGDDSLRRVRPFTRAR